MTIIAVIAVAVSVIFGMMWHRAKQQGNKAVLKFSIPVCILSALIAIALTFFSQTAKNKAALQAQTTSSSSQVQSVSLSDIPEYNGSPYVEINANKPFFTDDDKTTKAFEKYSQLDKLGRCGVAYALVCKEIMPTKERGAIGSVKPSGWHTVKYAGIDGNYLYNRCHLIGYQLAGENANERNLITGTRYLNVDGMLPFEDKVDDYVDMTKNHVLYRVTPVFDGDNLVASGVLMEAFSVEDEGKGVSFCVYCYNVQPGVTINYADGSSTGPEFKGSAFVTSKPAAAVAAQDYVLNTGNRKFHKPSCSSVSKIKKENRKDVKMTRDKIIDDGYEPCKSCKP